MSLLTSIRHNNNILLSINSINRYNNKLFNFNNHKKLFSFNFNNTHHYCTKRNILSSNLNTSTYKSTVLSSNIQKSIFSNISKHSGNITKLSKIWSLLPKSFHPYLLLLRLDKPIGVYLLFLPCIFSIALGMPIGQVPSLLFIKEVILFGLGALVMRGAGCIINDLWDRNIDKLVTRTQLRPIAAGDITVKNAILWLGVQLSIGLAILLQLNLNSILLGICSLPFVVIYPYMKRFFPIPQLVLGITFNWGALVGYVAVTNSLTLSILSLYIPCILWTIYYDTIYAVQDRVSDLKIGVRSSALTFDKYLVPITTAFGYSSIIGFSYMGYIMGLGSIYQVGVLVALAHMQYQLHTWKPRPIDELKVENQSNNFEQHNTALELINEEKERQNASKIFIMNKWFGLIIAGSIVTDRYFGDKKVLKSL